MPRSQSVLLEALRAAPRRYRLPSLPADGQAAEAADGAAALAFAIEAARKATLGVAPLPAGVEGLFLRKLADLIGEALRDPGDPPFRARVQQAAHPDVAEFVRLSESVRADARTVRKAIDAVAHPATLERSAPEPAHVELARLYTLSRAGDWPALRTALQRCHCGLDPQSHRFEPALTRLERHATLQSTPAVQTYLSLLALAGPIRGSTGAAHQGRSAARTGADAERITADAFRAIALHLDAVDGMPGAHRVARSLLPPRDLPGEAGKSKGEWDAAILRFAPDTEETADIALLAEVKASPSAVTRDFARLHRGLERLAQLDVDRDHLFASADGEVAIAGVALRALAPQGRSLPPHVLYCCTAETEVRPALLAAASQAVLLAEPASIAFALALQRGEQPPPAALVPVWQALATEPRLKATLHQDDTARIAREAMLHPDDLLSALRS